MPQCLVGDRAKICSLDRDGDDDDDRNCDYYTSQHCSQIQTKWQQFLRYLVQIQIITMAWRCRVVGLDDTMTCVCMMELTCTKETDIVLLFLWSSSLCFHVSTCLNVAGGWLAVGWKRKVHHIKGVQTRQRKEKGQISVSNFVISPTSIHRILIGYGFSISTRKLNCKQLREL